MFTSGRGTYGIPPSVSYQHYLSTGAYLTSPNSIDEYTPVAGVYTAAPAPPTWHETKYIVYNQADPTGLSPYLDNTVWQAPRFKTNAIAYTDSMGIYGDLSNRCQITTTSVSADW